MKEALLILPNQLFKQHPGIAKGRKVFLVEHTRYFTDFRFHKKKLILHRASMKAYAKTLPSSVYLERCSTKQLFAELKKSKVEALFVADPIDHPLLAELKKEAKAAKIELVIGETLAFLDTEPLPKKKKHFFTSFYIDQRKKYEVLLDGEKPLGGKWSFDPENREKLPKGIKIPKPPSFRSSKELVEATRYVEKHFKDNPGETEHFSFPVTHSQAQSALKSFLEKKLKLFGDYQDALSKDDSFLFHSALSAPLNCGLLTPKEVLEATLAYAKKHHIPLNSLEGFVRQLIGWREFVRALYQTEGESERKGNFFKHKRKIPTSFWEGSTKIVPIDQCIQRLLQTAYLHHIERLMVVGNFMLLAEFHPKEVYTWFMELFIDAYDWVMVPNVFGMSQYADGGLFTTKPYYSSSNYVLKMSDYKKGPWCQVWDALYWRFVAKHKAFLSKNARLSWSVKQYEKMTPEKKQALKEALKSYSAL